MILLSIIGLNAAFIIFSAILISSFSLTGTEHMSIPEAAFCTITMIMDAGCIQFVIEDIGQTNVTLAVICLSIIFIGMLIFTGALIGYITNFISGMIDRADEGVKRLHISDHTVILNWNTRASEIVNDLLYTQKTQKVVVLSAGDRKEIGKEIQERLSETVARENGDVRKKARELGVLQGLFYGIHNRFHNRVKVLIRQGDIFSTKQLEDISLKYAKSVIILGGDISSSYCKFETKEKTESRKKGNTLTLKTLMQVIEITRAKDSNDDQTVIVEITDNWTLDQVNKIIRAKEVDDRDKYGNKCNIVPVRVNIVLGQILSQFSLMPELNEVYTELFSNKGSAFYCEKLDRKMQDHAYIEKNLPGRYQAIPLTTMTFKDEMYGYYAAEAEDKIRSKDDPSKLTPITIHMNPNYMPVKSNIIILGHNARTREIMEGFIAYMSEWQSSGAKLHITVIDDERSNEKIVEYRQLIDSVFHGSDCFHLDFLQADLYDRKSVTESIRGIIDKNTTDTSVLILSDEDVAKEDIDADALTNLIYLQDIIVEKQKLLGDAFDTESIDVIVEIIDPKHNDVIRHYSMNNVVISNRYISKMVTQISEKEELYVFFKDILTYDTSDENRSSKEIYLKEVDRFFLPGQIPGQCTAAQLIRAVWEQSIDPAVFGDKLNPTLVLGYVRPHDDVKMHLFTKDQDKTSVKLQPRDKLIVYSLH